MLSIARGTSVVVENLFESRFKHVGELKKLGADILVNDKTAIIKGKSMLYGANVTCQDLRGGAGLVLAGLVAKGYTTVELLFFGIFRKNNTKLTAKNICSLICNDSNVVGITILNCGTGTCDFSRKRKCHLILCYLTATHSGALAPLIVLCTHLAG